MNHFVNHLRLAFFTIFLMLVVAESNNVTLAKPLEDSATIKAHNDPQPTSRQSPPHTPASPGDPVATIAVPVPASIGVSVAYDGTYLYYTNLGDTNLYKITTDGTLVETIAVGVNLGAMSWDAGRQKLWAGTLDGSRDIYLVDPNTGTLEFQFDAPDGPFDFHDGLAYDASDDTIWFSDDVQYTVYHLTTSGDILGTIPVGFPNSGIAVGGPALYMGSNGWGIIYKVDKATGDILETFATPGGRDEDLECDNVTFAPLEVMWSKDAYDNTITAFEVTPGTCQFGVIPSPQGQLQLHIPDALPIDAPIRPVVTVINEDPAPADYTVVVQLWRGFSLLAEQTQDVSFAWSGRQQLTFDFGVYSPDSYYIWAELWQGGEQLQFETQSFVVGLDYLKLRATVGDLTNAGYSELNDSENIAVDALSHAAATGLSETVDVIVDKLASLLLTGLTGIEELLPDDVDFAVDELVGKAIDFSVAVELGTYETIYPYYHDALDRNTFNGRRESVSAAETALLQDAADQSFTWDPAWGSEMARRKAAINGKNETVGGLGLELDFEPPFVHRASSVEMKGQFNWVKDELLPIIDSVSKYLLIGFLLVLAVAAIIVLLPTSAIPPAFLAAVIIVAKVVAALYAALLKILLTSQASKFLIATVVLAMFAFSIAGTAESIVSPEVVSEHQNAMDYLQQAISGGLSAGSISPMNISTQVHNSVVGLNTQLGTEGDPVWLETQLFRGDGKLLEIVDYGLADAGASAGNTWRLPAGPYWAVTVAHGRDTMQIRQTSFQATSPYVILDLALSDNQLDLGEPLEATVTLTNQNVVTGTGTLVLNVMALDGEGFQVWLPELGPSESVAYDYSFIPQNEGGYVLRAAVGDDMGAIARVDHSFVVGDTSALAINISPQTDYPPSQNITWTMTAVNAGTQPTTTLLALNTYDRSADYALVYSTVHTITLDAGANTSFTMTVLTAALPGAYSTHLVLGNHRYCTDDFLVTAEGALFAIVNAEPSAVSVSESVTLTVDIQDETYTSIDANVMLNLYAPDGSAFDVPLTQIGTGRYQGTHTTGVAGTYSAEVTASRSNYASTASNTFFTADDASLLLLDTQGELALDVTRPITLSVYNEHLWPVSNATVIVSGTNGLTIGQTDHTGIVSLVLRPVTTDTVTVHIEKPGFASTGLHLPVAVVSDTVAPNLSMILPSLTNEATLTFNGLTEPGVTLTINSEGVSVASDGVFTATVNLTEGNNLITGIATDGANNSTLVTKTVALDTVAPVLTLTWPPNGLFITGTVVTVTGTTDPDASLLINNLLIDVQPDGSFLAWVRVDTPGANIIAASAVDRAGNEVMEERVIWRPSKLYLPLVMRN